MTQSGEGDPGTQIVFLHHSTGRLIWNGGKDGFASRIVRKLSSTIGLKTSGGGLVPALLTRHNRRFGTHYHAKERIFPKETPYGWRNYPFDYYNIWVNHAGPRPFRQEPTLELLTKDFQVIMFKHCFPVSNIQPEQGQADINSDYRSLANYQLQYLALREKFERFPSTKFIVWTGAAQVKSRTNEEEARRASAFVSWVIHEWDRPDDNIFLWDFYGLQTEGALYFQEKSAQSAANSHPNGAFAKSAAGLLLNRLVDVIETDGSETDLEGRWKHAEKPVPRLGRP